MGRSGVGVGLMPTMLMHTPTSMRRRHPPRAHMHGVEQPPLVVVDAPPPKVAVFQGRLKGGALPKLQGVDRLHVVMACDGLRNRSVTQRRNDKAAGL